MRGSRRAIEAAALLAALLSSACGKEPAQPTAPGAAARPTLPAPQQTAIAERNEAFQAVAAYVLTDAVVDGVAAVDKDLETFWADPESVGRIRGQVSLPKVMAAIDATPEFVAALEKHKLAPRDYVLGTLSMIGGYSYEQVRIRDPKGVEGKKPPVTEETLVVIRKRFADVEQIVRPKGPQVPVPAAPQAPEPASPSTAPTTSAAPPATKTAR